MVPAASRASERAPAPHRGWWWPSTSRRAPGRNREGALVARLARATAGLGPTRRGPGSARRGRLGVADQLLVEERLALGLADRDHLVALAEHRVGAERRRDPVADH